MKRCRLSSLVALALAVAASTVFAQADRDQAKNESPSKASPGATEPSPTKAATPPLRAADPQPPKKAAAPRQRPHGYKREQPRHFLARFHGEIIGRMIWHESLFTRSGAWVERAEREFFVRDREKQRFRFSYIERQSTRQTQLNAIRGALRDGQFSGRFRLQGRGAAAKIESVFRGNVSDSKRLAAPPNYEAMAKIAPWCVKHREEKGKSRKFSRPVWFTYPAKWGELMIIAEGPDPARLEDGGKIDAWRFRVQFEKSPRVYALVWLDDQGKPVRRELPYCGLTFTGCDKKAYEDLSKMMTWESAMGKWKLRDDRTMAAILTLAHEKLEHDKAKKKDGAEKVEAPSPPSDSEVETEAQLMLFLFFL